eukprot:6200306-Pleurochrysis_carterae.AAC.1
MIIYDEQYPTLRTPEAYILARGVNTIPYQTLNYCLLSILAGGGGLIGRAHRILTGPMGLQIFIGPISVGKEGMEGGGIIAKKETGEEDITGARRKAGVYYIWNPMQVSVQDITE